MLTSYININDDAWDKNLPSTLSQWHILQMRTLELSHNDWRKSHKLILNINIVHTLDKRKKKVSSTEDKELLTKR